MSVLAVQHLWQGDRTSEDDKGVRKYEKKFRVITSVIDDGPQVVKQATGIPRRSDPYSLFLEDDDDEEALCVNVDAQRTEEPRIWEVTCQYSTETKDPNEVVENPLDEPADIDYDTVPYQRPVVVDYDGKLIANSSGLPFDPPLEVPDDRPLITIERNEASFDFGLALAYKNAVNNDDFWGQPLYSAMLKTLKGKKQYKKNLMYWRVTYQIEFNPDLWVPRKVLDAGMYVLDSSSPPKRQAILDDLTGLAVSHPWPLDGHGKKLATNAAPVLLEFNLHKKLPFGDLNLPYG